ncbi:thiamine biosynthesis protein ThiH [Dehalobacter restrictus]|uniref:thiamine biosynthesis protein ThiH n=1 Tax=Dehalobacter restrictus TaxID=55583 RepID=UPI00338FEDE5
METFVPLYISNICDSSCLMCNLRRNNPNVKRVEANTEIIRRQLKIIKDFENISAVCFLTGERSAPADRLHNLKLIINSIKFAFEIGFKKAFFNIGSLTAGEVRILSQEFNASEKPKLVLSLFQETYDRSAYSKYFGNDKSGSKADYDKRLSTIDIWVEHGFSAIDIGILLGFERPLEDDINALIAHANKFVSASIEVYVSTPRIKGGSVSDDTYKMVLKQIRSALPKAKLILTTRESVSFINDVIDLFDVVSPGSSDICPYSYDEYIPNNVSTSQFIIDEKRLRPSVVLDQINCKNIVHYNKQS